MTVGHIKLGAVGSTLKDYVLIDEHRYRKVTANPYSAKISTGGGTYDDLEPFAYWVQDDWQSGIGHKNPDEGLLFSTAETRVPNQIILPQVVVQSDTRQVTGNVDDARNIGRLAASSVVTVGPAQTYRKLRWRVDAPSAIIGATGANIRFSVYARIPSGAQVTLSLYTTATGSTLVAGAGNYTTTYTSAIESPIFTWHQFAAPEVVGGATVWAELNPDTNIDLPVTVEYTDADSYYHSGTNWVQVNDVQPIYTTNYYRVAETFGIDAIHPIVRFNNTLYAGQGTQMVKYTAASNTWATVGAARGGNITDMQVWGATLHVGLDSGNYDTLSTADAYTTAGVTRSLFAKWNGYLWSKWGHNLYYAADGATWSSAIPVGHAGSTITGMAGLGDTLYVATTEALYYIAPGDIAVGVTRWGSNRSTNGSHLVNHQGSLYCIVDGGVAQIAVSGGSASVLPLWVQRDDDLVASYLHTPTALISTNNWLVAMVQDSAATLNAAANVRCSLWVWTGQGWHFLTEYPFSRVMGIYYDFSTSKIWGANWHNSFFSVRVPDYTLNPVNDTSSSYVPSAWFETGWITGGLKDVEKDFESVYISGDTLNASQYVEVYYKSSRSGAWTYLGKIDDYGEEVRWSDYTTRPASKELKLGFRLFSTSLTATPDIDVIRLKFLPNVNDRWQWTLPISVSPSQEFIDGTLNANSVAQMMAHLDSLVKSTPPFLLQDLDGTQYEVVCTGASVDVQRLDFYNGTKVPYYVYTLNLEQVRGASYA